MDNLGVTKHEGVMAAGLETIWFTQVKDNLILRVIELFEAHLDVSEAFATSISNERVIHGKVTNIDGKEVIVHNWCVWILASGAGVSGLLTQASAVTHAGLLLLN
jgi:hypothetical protein